jgi:AcrR family transcriptional regulator
MTTAADADGLRERIVDAALELAERRSWETVRLHAVAEHLGVSLTDISRHFREKEDVVEAWFDRADRAMLAAAAAPEFRALATPRERLHRVIMHWLTALGPHRRVTRQMILGKLEPGHLHIQIPGLLRVSRTVQWMREAAALEPPGMTQRAFEEVATTGIYLMTFVHWMLDDSPQAARTAQFLERRLKDAERLARLLPAGPPTPPAAGHDPH